MTDFLIYDAKVAVLIAVFYMFYRLLLSRETFHRVNRIVLLATAVTSFVLPLCVITMHETVTMPMPEMDMEFSAVAVEQAVSVPWWQIALPILFIIGMCATLGHTLLSLVRIILLIRRSEQHPQEDGTIVCVTGNAALSPFSWMHYIVMNRADYEAHDSAILAHERGHIRLRHSWDLLLVDTLTALQWFNPAMWMLRSDLRAIHEYEADGAVLSLGINARQYQYLLITKAAGIGGYSLANGISHSTLKNRINMMLHKKSQSSHLLKLL
ncbi:MAG: M56 family metallopeptidase, partial [Prevotella sp.]|nr:M56 family metallopeptidase [Prevotella sp.]